MCRDEAAMIESLFLLLCWVAVGTNWTECCGLLLLFLDEFIRPLISHLYVYD